jgi:hypothetical protein
MDADAVTLRVMPVAEDDYVDDVRLALDQPVKNCGGHVRCARLSAAVQDRGQDVSSQLCGVPPIA